MVSDLGLVVMGLSIGCDRRFTEAELRDLKKLFVSLAYQSRSGGEYVIASVFQVPTQFAGFVGSRAATWVDTF